MTIVEANQAALNLYGYSRDDFINLPLMRLVDPSDQPRVARLIESGVVLEREGPFKQVHHDGRTSDTMISAFPLRFSGRDCRVVIAEDVSDNLRLERQLNQAQRLESLGQLAGGVAHDFNNLLGVILGFTGFVSQQLTRAANESDPERWQKSLDDLARVETAATSASQLTRQLLAFARREVAQPRVVSVNQAVEQVEQLLRRSLGEHVRMEIRTRSPVSMVRIDPGQLEQVVVNLSVNARDAMPDGGNLVIETLDVEVDEAYAATQLDLSPGGYVGLRVSDTGTGMPESVLLHAFEPFFTTKASGLGTGLGLATVYGIVTQAGGNIHIYSEVGKGTTVTVLLPGAVAPDEEAPAPAAVAPAPSGEETVLVVEDAADLRAAIVRMLERRGYRVLQAGGGPGAIRTVEESGEPVHLLLTDVAMPQMLGTELAAALTPLHPGLRVLYMSGFPQQILGASGTLGPESALLEKPFTESALLSKVRAVLNS
jgi:PAS domain S-box-containing protein